jgi:hypothetical protein
MKAAETSGPDGDAAPDVRRIVESGIEVQQVNDNHAEAILNHPAWIALGGGGFRKRCQARHAGAKCASWVNQVNYNCTDFTDFTDCASASTAPRTRAEQLGARVARSSHRACR